MCGSDGVTYENGCNAECAGATIVKVGDCPSDGGACTCSPVSDPVCGVNGVTYENACSATCAHEGIAHTGVCAAPVDASAPPTDGSTASSPGACGTQTCGANQVCVDDACPVAWCLAASDAGACPAGFTHTAGSCYPGGPLPSDGVCTRACPTPRHHCVTPSCSPVTCACLPEDICASVGGMCAGVSGGQVTCVSGGTAAP